MDNSQCQCSLAQCCIGAFLYRSIFEEKQTNSWYLAETIGVGEYVRDIGVGWGGGSGLLKALNGLTLLDILWKDIPVFWECIF